MCSLVDRTVRLGLIYGINVGGWGDVGGGGSNPQRKGDDTQRGLEALVNHSVVYIRSNVKLRNRNQNEKISVVDPNTLYLNPDPEFGSILYQDPMVMLSLEKRLK